MSNPINAYTVVAAIDNMSMELVYEERFNNRTGDIDSKTFIKFYKGSDCIASLSKINEQKPVLFGQDSECYARMFQLLK